MSYRFRMLIGCALVLSPVATAGAGEPAAGEGTTKVTNTAYLEKLPPLIDRELLFGDPKIAGAQIAPDGQHITFVKPYNDVMNVWIKKTAEPFEAARPLTADTARPVTSYFWTRDSRYVLYLQDSGGDENFHIFAVDPRAEASGETGVPAARDLTPFDGVAARIYGLPKEKPDEIVLGLNDRDPALHDVWRLTISTGERELLEQNDANMAGYLLDIAGNVRFGVRLNGEGGTEVLDVTGDAPRLVYECSYEESCSPLRVHKDGKRVYMSTNRGDDVDLARLTLLDPATGTEEVIHVDPEGEVDLANALFSGVTDELVGVAYVGDRVRIYPLDDRFAARLDFLRAKLPDGEIGLASSTTDERIGLASVSSDVDPGSVFLYDLDAKKVSKLYSSRPELPTEHLAPMTPIRYEARDGRKIPAYLTVPRGAEAKDLPTIIMPHGGPWARDTWGYDPFAQYLANRGYAVLQPNFRGSTGYGKSFLNEGNGEWGTGIMQHDLSDAVAHLVAEGIADPDRVAIMGGSYGGYATLAGLAFTPDLYAAGISIVGPSNIITLLDSIPAYWGPIKTIFSVRVGDPDDPEDRKRLIAQSPLNSADAIVAPLLVIQGANDPRVKQQESDQIVATLRDLERTVAYMVAPDEGHGFAGEENRMAMMVEIERFLAEQLSGRVQREVPTALASHLKGLQVDVASVEMPVLPEDLGVAMSAPLPAIERGALVPATLRYTSTVDSPQLGEEIEVKQTRRLTEEMHEGTPVLRVASEMSSRMGEGSDEFLLDRETLRPVKLVRTQGQMLRVDVDYGDDRITGTMKMGPQEMKLDQPVDAPSFGDSAALDLVVSSLPLTEGYETPLRIFEPLFQRFRSMSAKVEAKEAVNVAGESREAFRVALEPLDGELGGYTYWISVDLPRTMLKSTAEIPPMQGGGTVSTELTGVEG